MVVFATQSVGRGIQSEMTSRLKPLGEEFYLRLRALRIGVEQNRTWVENSTFGGLSAE